MTREDWNDVRGEGTHFEIGGTLAELEGAHDGVWDDAKTHARQPGGVTEIVGIALEDNFFVLGLLNETKGTGADRMAGKIGANAFWDDSECGANEIDCEGSVGFAEMKNDGEVVGSFDVHDQAESTTFCRFVVGVSDEVDRVFDVGGGERTAVVETDTLAKVEDVGEWIGSVPGFGEVAVEVHLIVAFEQAAEEKAIDALRLRVGGEAGVQVGRAGFDEEG